MLQPKWNKYRPSKEMLFNKNVLMFKRKAVFIDFLKIKYGL